jgi:hypothetical protein
MPMWRHIAAPLIMVGGFGLIFVLFGTYGLAGAFLGLLPTYFAFGVGLGYWWGHPSDQYVIELMRILRARGIIQ